jgi:hypothetical protein
LVAGLADEDPVTAAVAAAALYRRLLEDSAVPRVSPQTSIFQTHVEPMLQQATPLAGVIASVAIGSLFTVSTVPASVIERETDDVHAAVRRRACAVVGLVDSDPILEILLRQRDFVGLSVHVGERLERNGRIDEAQTLFRAASDGAVRLSDIPQVRMQARLNRARALLRVGDRDAAAKVAASVIDLGVLQPAAQLHGLKILLACGVSPESVRVALAEVERFYKLPPEAVPVAEALRQMVLERTTPAFP